MLSDAVNRHIELYRSMGFKYRVQAYMLQSFAAFAQNRSEQFIHTDTVVEWATSAPSIRQRYDRLLTVRRLACTLNAEDERHEVPPADVFGHAPRRRRTPASRCAISIWIRTRRFSLFAFLVSYLRAAYSGEKRTAKSEKRLRTTLLL